MADALDSGSSGSNTVQVQVLLSAPRRNGLRSIQKARSLTGLFSYRFVIPSFPQKVPFAPAARLQAPSRRRCGTTNLLRVIRYTLSDPNCPPFFIWQRSPLPRKSSVTSGHGPTFADREGKRQFPQGLELELEPTPKGDIASELTLTNPDRLRTEGR